MLVHIAQRDNILKRLLVHAGGFNLALIMRKLVGMGKPRRWQGAFYQLVTILARLFRWLWFSLRAMQQRLYHFALQSSLDVKNAGGMRGISQVIDCRFAA